MEIKELLAEQGIHIGIRSLYKRLDVLVEQEVIEPARIMRTNRMNVRTSIHGWKVINNQEKED